MTTPSQVEELSRKDVAQDEMKKQFVATESETSSAGKKNVHVDIAKKIKYNFY